jgi:hypothetical protein
MKRIFTILVLVILGFSLYAQGNIERMDQLTELEGTIEIVKDSTGRPTVLLVLDDGTKVELEIPELVAMQLQARERIKLQGIILESTGEAQVKQQLFVRSMNRNGVETVVENPVQLTAQQRLQLNQMRTQQQTQTQSGTLTQTQTQTQGGTQTGQGTETKPTDAGSGKSQQSGNPSNGK